MKLFFAFTITLLAALPALALGADEFVPLAPIPNLDTGPNASLGSYINSLFLLIISVAAMLAVIKVVIGGFQYMTQTSSSAATSKARETIRDAIIGLILLLSSYLILSIVNPQILSLEALRFSALGPSDAVRGTIEQNRADALRRQAEIEAGAKAFADEKNWESYESSLDSGIQNQVLANELTDAEKRKYRTECLAGSGRKYEQGSITRCRSSSTNAEYSASRLPFGSFSFKCEVGDTQIQSIDYLRCYKPSGN